MSLEDVKAFYQRLGTDEAFRTQIQGVNSKDECSQTIKCAGYDFTQEELEEYTLQLLELSADEDGLADLDEQELATVFGGLGAQPLYRIKLAGAKPLSLQQLELLNKLSIIKLEPSNPISHYGVVMPQDFTAQTFILPQENSKQI